MTMALMRFRQGGFISLQKTKGKIGFPNKKGILLMPKKLKRGSDIMDFDSMLNSPR